MNRELLMLAHKYIPTKYNIGGWYISEKLDGTRCFWDGGLSRGLPTTEVPWANLRNPKTKVLKDKIKPMATGLWSRYGNPIMAPDWFLNLLPPLMLDGELWAGRGNFQLTRSIVAQDNPDDRWNQIEFAVFSTPHPSNFSFDGIIKNPNMYCVIDAYNMDAFIKIRNETLGGGLLRVQDGATFEDELVCLRDALEGNQVYLHGHRKLPEINPEKVVDQYLERVLADGGEGVVLRDPTSQWEPRRVRTLLKYKPFSDDEGTLVGFTAGKGKYLGMIGALILNYNGMRLELSGLTDEERALADKDQFYATTMPGGDMPANCHAKHFRIGDKVTFKYRELSDDNIPKEARFSRKREDE